MRSFCSPLFLAAGLFAALGLLAPLGAQQTVTFGSVSPTPTDLAGGLSPSSEFLYLSTIGGSNVDLTFPGYNVIVTSGSNGGEALTGQTFLAICVNVSYPSMSGGTFDLSTDGSTLSYDVNSTDVWSVSRAAKYGAIRDIIADHGNTLIGLDQNGLEFQERMTAMTFAFAQIAIDGSGEPDPLNVGGAQFRWRDGSALSGNILDYFNEYMASAGTGSGDALTLYSAGVGGTSNQDVILIPVPEPSAALLGGLAGVAVFLRRRRA